MSAPVSTESELHDAYVEQTPGCGPYGCTSHIAHLETDGADLFFADRVVINNISQRAAFHVLHDNPQFCRPDQERVEVVHNVWMLGFFHNKDLVHNELFPR